jgi:hypothetical protein
MLGRKALKVPLKHIDVVRIDLARGNAVESQFCRFFVPVASTGEIPQPNSDLCDLLDFTNEKDLSFKPVHLQE